MTNTLPLVFDQTEFDTFCAIAKKSYNPVTSFVYVRVNEAAEQFHQLRAQGYQLLDPMSPTDSFAVIYPAPGVTASPYVQIHLNKPQPVQDEELKEVYKNVRATYELTLAKRLEDAVKEEYERRARAAEAVQREARLRAAQEEASKAKTEMEAIKKAILEGLAPAKATKAKKAS